MAFGSKLGDHLRAARLNTRAEAYSKGIVPLAQYQRSIQVEVARLETIDPVRPDNVTLAVENQIAQAPPAPAE